MSVDPKEKETMEKGNDDRVAEEKNGKYRIVFRCGFSSEEEE